MKGDQVDARFLRLAQDHDRQNQMSKQNAESLLKNIVEREERNTQEKLKKIQQNPPSKRLEKNW